MLSWLLFYFLTLTVFYLLENCCIKDEKHPKPFAEGKDIERWVSTSYKWFEWGTLRSPSLLRRPTFAELYEQKEKIMLVKIGATRAVLDFQGLYCNEGIYPCILWKDLCNVRNKSIQKAAKYVDEAKQNSDLPSRENLEQNSLRFSIKYLLGIINSSVSRNFLQQNRRNNVQLYPDDWKNLPIPDISMDQQQPIIELVDKILDAKGQNVGEWERAIDEIVARLYGLSDEEIQIIRGNTE